MSSIIHNYVLKLLALREHSKHELEHKLINKGFEISEIVPVLKKLELDGLQSDSRFVESYIYMRFQRGFGPIKIKAELNERGVATELIEQSLAEYKSKWLDLAKRVRIKKFGESMPRNWNDQTKQMRYLYYKGFDNRLIQQIFNEYE